MTIFNIKRKMYRAHRNLNIKYNTKPLNRVIQWGNGNVYSLGLAVAAVGLLAGVCGGDGGSCGGLPAPVRYFSSCDLTCCTGAGDWLVLVHGDIIGAAATLLGPAGDRAWGLGGCGPSTGLSCGRGLWWSGDMLMLRGSGELMGFCCCGCGGCCGSWFCGAGLAALSSLMQFSIRNSSRSMYSRLKSSVYGIVLSQMFGPRKADWAANKLFPPPPTSFTLFSGFGTVTYKRKGS